MNGVLRTPDERFRNLPGWRFEPRYIDGLRSTAELRMHYVDEGPRDGQEVFLCLHGQPTWSYLYRKMIPVFTAARSRVVAPDFFGFGRSDKLEDEARYSFDFHRRSLIELIEALDLRNITLVVQDWGGLLGLTLPHEMPDRIDRLLVMNTGLATGLYRLPPAFFAWREWAANHPDMAIGSLVGRACPHLSDEERAAYDAPFPDGGYKAGVRQFPKLVPDSPEAPGAAVSQTAAHWLKHEWRGQTFMAVGMKDEILGPEVMAALRQTINGCPEPMEIAEAGHFVQEWGDEVARRALVAFAGTAAS